MRYATRYDVGERKRPDGINEDSLAVSVFEDGHREGYLGPDRDPSSRANGDPNARGDADPGTTRSTAVVVLADGAGGHEAGDVASYIATTRVAEELAPLAVRAAGEDPGAFGLDLPDTVSVGGAPPAEEGDPTARAEGESGNGTGVGSDPASSSRPRQDRFHGAIEAAIQQAHQDVLAYASEAGTAAYTTVVAGLVVDGRFHYGWVGDSRAYVCNGAHDHIARLTEDHAVVEQLYADGELDGVEAHVHPRGNELTRAVGGRGDAADVTVETASVDLFAEDVLLLTSDGLPDAQSDAPALYDRYVGSGRGEDAAARVREQVVTDADIGEWVLGADSLSAAADRLITEGNDRGGKDNLSVLLAQDPTLPETPSRLPVRGRDPHPAHRRETVVEE
ncbi:PP2C family protein-serine/threonine phosphatase [Salinirussus salinus]|jgi:serine/threonine protein phosphatase PrpC|uniref:PP2C family protein-serine/threonine phosphatase n=1 Tax=Salinirussus salinus TaxID=1198300 RepID=UPI0013574F73|nr:protein phosphatase 2C domain-containing protein [Salinirussus salinus]